MDDDKFLAIMGKLSEVGERTARIETKQVAAEDRLGKIEGDLKEHIKGTVINAERLNIEIQHREMLAEAHAKLKNRVEKLEIPQKVIQFLKSRIMWIALAGAGIVAILSYIKHG